MERPFMDRGHRPDDPELAEALADAFPSWSSLVAIAAGFAAEWSFAGRSGWLLKISDRGKALLYLVPLRSAFRASLTIREAERVGFLADPDLAAIHDQIRDARRYPEGYALLFDIDAGSKAGTVESFLGKLVAVRRRS
jgi:hypothetical protein